MHALNLDLLETLWWRWHDSELGFDVLLASKAAYYDGHERDDVIQYRGEFL